jgi:hypothetical protein
MASIWDYISPTGEGSQARSKWLRENVDQPISEAARYYLGAGTGVPSLLDLAADGTPSAGLGRASQASQKLFSPDQSVMDRITSAGNLLSETVGVGAGLLGANQTARIAGPALEDATLAVGRNVAERLNQRGPMPTLGSNGGNIPALSKADQMRREANIQRFGYDPNEPSVIADTSYRGGHQPRGPQSENPVRLDDITISLTGERAGYPSDFYGPSGSRYYAPGPRFADDQYGIANQQSYRAIMKAKGNPDAEVTIYRAVPNEDNITSINEGDFVTLSPKYAEIHGAEGYGPGGNDPGKIISQKVKVKDIYFAGDDVNEFGYFPEALKDRRK